MGALEGLGYGFSIALLPTNLAACFVGVLIGTIVGILPGIGPVGAFSIDRDEFLEAVTGHVVSRSLARERSVDLRTADAERLALD